MASPEVPEVVSILRSVYHILKAPAGKDYLIEIAKQSDEFTANWCASNLTNLKEKKTANETHTINKVDSPNNTRNINQNENSSNTTINSEKMLLPVEESSFLTDNINRKRKADTSENNTDTMAACSKPMSYKELADKIRCSQRENEIEEAIKNKSVSGMKEKQLLEELTTLHQTMKRIKTEDAEVVPVLDVIDFGAKSIAKVSNDDTTIEQKPLEKEKVQGTKEAVLSKSLVPSSTQPTTSSSQSTSNDIQIDVLSFSDTESTCSVPYNVFLSPTSDTSNGSSCSFSEQYIRPIDEEEGDRQIVPNYAPPQIRNSAVMTRKNEICGYKISEKEFKCATCSKILTCRRNLQNHSSIHHGFGDTLQCPHCRRNFTIERNFEKHVTSVCPFRDVYMNWPMDQSTSQFTPF